MGVFVSRDGLVCLIWRLLLTLSTKGYGSRFVIHSFCLVHSFKDEEALTASRQLTYEQAKHVDGFQSDSWILLKCFRSRVMAGSPWWPSLTLLKTKPPIVGCPDTYGFDPYCRTALGVSEKAYQHCIKVYTAILQRGGIIDSRSRPAKQPRVTKMDSSLRKWIDTVLDVMGS